MNNELVAYTLRRKKEKTLSQLHTFLQYAKNNHIIMQFLHVHYSICVIYTHSTSQIYPHIKILSQHTNKQKKKVKVKKHKNRKTGKNKAERGEDLAAKLMGFSPLQNCSCGQSKHLHNSPRKKTREHKAQSKISSEKIDDRKSIFRILTYS